MLYDVFISHANEDKDDFVRPLAISLKENNIEVWYDEFSLKPGDSLRQSIDKGLLKSRFGIIVLSKNFFAKEWTNWELDGLLQKQISTGHSLLIPIWYGIDKNEILKYSPSLADKIAILSKDKSINEITNKIIGVINPEGSTLLIARDMLLKYGITPPIITDDWWLDVVEFSSSNPVEGTFQDGMGWGYWGFPLPEKGDTPQSRGIRLGQAALQMLWQENVAKNNICQITHPKIVIDFIEKQPGLLETCLNYPEYLAVYAPQLMIKEFSGPFSDIFNQMYEASLKEQYKLQANNSTYGTGLTIDGKVPLCDEMVALRNESFGNYHASHIACFWFQGPIMGPSNDYYDKIDYIAWLISHNSSWLHPKIRNYLIQGMREWAMWHWDGSSSGNARYKSDSDTGSLFHKMFDVKCFKNFKLTKKAYNDLFKRLEFSKKYWALMNRHHNW